MRLCDIMPSTLTLEQREKYSSHIGNINYLTDYLATEPSAYEVGILIKLEIEGKQRAYIFSRLLGRLATIVRKKMKNELDNIMLGE